jgi:hypothetical protein
LNIQPTFRNLEKLVIDNSPALLTSIGVIGTVSTAYLTGKATYDAVVSEFLENYETSDWQNDLYGDYTAKTRVRKHWKRYIPAVGTGALTIAAIVSANRIGTRRAAGIAAAFTLSERAFTEYKEKVISSLGSKKEQELRDELTQSRVSSTPGSTQVVITGVDSLCLDAYTGRYFTSNMEALRKAQNDLNAAVLHNSYASLTDFYNLLGIPKTIASDEVGWNTDKLLDLKIGHALSEDGRPCISIEYDLVSNRDYWRNN